MYDSIQSLLFGIRKLLPLFLDDGKNQIREGKVEMKFERWFDVSDKKHSKPTAFQGKRPHLAFTSEMRGCQHLEHL